MTPEGNCLMAENGILMGAQASVFDLSGVKLLKTSLLGMVSFADKGICRGIYKICCGHRLGIVVICIDRLMLLDVTATKLVTMLVQRAMINYNIVHMVVGTGAVRARALQIGFDQIAGIHDSYDDFVARKSR